MSVLLRLMELLAFSGERCELAMLVAGESIAETVRERETEEESTGRRKDTEKEIYS